jgi:hypothetical protein
MDIELQKIVEVYNSLLLAVENGELEISSALTTLSNLSAIDATGAEWKMDPSGSWLRGFPGGPKSPANPEFFVSTAGRTQSNTQSTSWQSKIPETSNYPSPHVNNAPRVEPYPQTRESGNFDFISNIDSFNGEYSKPTKDREHVESTFSFATKLIKSKFNLKSKLGPLLKNRTLVLLVLSAVVVVIALYSSNQNKERGNTVKSNNVVTENSKAPSQPESTIEEIFTSELKAGNLSSFSYLEDNSYADLIGLSQVDKKFELSNLLNKDKVVSFTLIFTLKDEMVSKKITLRKSSKGWVAEL